MWYQHVQRADLEGFSKDVVGVIVQVSTKHLERLSTGIDTLEHLKPINRIALGL